ncbi:MAG: hypothetical protein AAB227_07185 [Pseudomonadota bacterium]
MKQQRAFSGTGDLALSQQALPLSLCWAFWIGSSATLWAIILKLL